MNPISVFAPAKLNLFLAVTGRRADGFHDLVSLAVPLDFGDQLEVTSAEQGFALTCDDPAVPLDESNLVIKAAQAFAAASGWRGGAKFFLRKRIPMGAGLGGGSSDAVAALRALNALSGGALPADDLLRVAGRLGSDCPLFLHDAPVVMRGRGERIEALDERAEARLRGGRVLVFKPAFGIATPWAYAQMAARPETYLPEPEAEARLAAWRKNAAAPIETLLFNNMERAAFAKFLALPTLLAVLREKFGVTARMSGSGSACFAVLSDDAPVAEMVTTIRAAWGEAAFVVEARVLGPAKHRHESHANPH